MLLQHISSIILLRKHAEDSFTTYDATDYTDVF